MSLIYDTFTLGAPDNLVTFNDYFNTGAPAIYRVEQRYPTKRSITEFDVKLPEINGISDFQTLLGKEYYIIEGEMYPQNEDGFHQGRRILRRLADMATVELDPESDAGYIPLQWNETIGGVASPRQLFLKVLYVDMKESTAQGIVQPFVLYCKIKDPTIYGTSLITATTGQAASFASPTGTVGYPIKFPVLYGASTGSVSNQANNPGDASTYPTITVIGPVTNPRVTNTSTGEYIEIDAVLNSSSDILVISYSGTNASITLNGNSAYQSKASGSTFFKLKPGISNFSLTGTSLGGTAQATISFLPAWPLS